ncbi:ABC transporter ATP-binding protein [Clostridiaceae bacterium M8S5]|nr:ABC transporter ATP-binding protein [Clostridiaceae bacterium M8S5]
MEKKYNIFDLFKIPYKANSKLFFIKIFEYILYSVLPLLEFYVMSNFINLSIETVKGKSLNNITFPLILLILIVGFKHLSEQIFKLSTYKLELEIDKYLKNIFLIKKAKLNYTHIENDKMYNKANRLSDKAGQRVLNGLNAFLNIIIILIKLATSICLVAKYLGAKSIIIILVSIPILILSSYNGRATYKNTKNLTKDSRFMDYLSIVLTSKRYCEERSLFNYSDTINDKWKKLSRSKIKKTYRLIAKLFFRMDISAILMILLSGVTIYYFVLKAVEGVVSLGVVIALTNLLRDLSDQFRWGIMNNVSTLAEDKEYFGDFDEFMSLTEKKDSITERVYKEIDVKKIVLTDVSFSYPTSDRKILKNINFEFKKGKHYAIVGKNGCGKTTLVKLLTGMYSNYEGEILIDNVELKSLDINTIRNMYSIAFQDFARYPIDIKSNVVFGDINKEDKDKLNQCLEAVDMYEYVNKLDDKESTLLGKIKENSTELSGGQWQKLSMARVLYNPSNIRILDEPTAALDPISESQLYENFSMLSKNVTSIFISHRLGSTMLADTIIVLDNGEIVETGSHTDLMKNKGLYYELYSKQRSWYKR